MNPSDSASFFGRMEEAARAAHHDIVPLHDGSVFRALAEEAARSAAQHGGEGLILITDSRTAGQCAAVSEARQRAAHAIVFGDPPKSWPKSSNLFGRSGHGRLGDEEQALVLLSPNFSVALGGAAAGPEEDGWQPFRGGWSVHAGCVRTAAVLLLGDKAPELAAIPEAGTSGAAMAAAAMRLMALHAAAVATRQIDIVMDKQDLFSVLNILKAISAKRRAHDILYVFVEQIARVVTTDRCSIVRVWGSEQVGHVLASHEDATVNDRTIELEKYPELVASMRSRAKVCVDDALNDPLTAPHAKDLTAANIQSLLVIPIVLFDENVGSLFLRAARSRGSFSLREISFFEIVAEAASNALERSHLFESIQMANDRLERLAITDGLTGLYNHRFVTERLGQEFERAKRYRQPLSCMILDIDNFKSINDTHGHLTGDRVLRQMAERTQQSVRKTDLVARYGGEEFVVLLPQTTGIGAKAEGERLRSIIAARPFDGMPDQARVTVSIGVSTLDHETMTNHEALLKAADRALYEAKRTGKDRVVFSED